MQKGNTMSFVKGVGAGMVAGAAAVVAGKMMMQDKHNVSKGSAKVVKAVGEIVEGVQTIFK
ncbi:MAG: hypothetical protein U0L33_01620 [Acutalibacteraceae bacterium]|nr:hypothetical protein [Acutalibacteraceae bacterium]